MMQLVLDLLSIRVFLHLVVGTTLTLLLENFKILTSEYKIKQAFLLYSNHSNIESYITST